MFGGKDMGIDLRNDKLLTFTQAGALIPSRQGKTVHGRTVRRWAKDGIELPDGSILKLATVRVGPRKLVSVAALGRFIDAMTEAAALVTAEREMRRRFFQKSPAPNPFVDVSRSCRA